MKFHALACEVLAKECLQSAAKSNHTVDIDFLPFGSHDHTDEMRTLLQKRIDAVSGRCDYILLAFGLCGGATAGLVARETPIVVPRAHECITILLGSRDLYYKEFGSHPGTYYLPPGWLDRKSGARSIHDVHVMPEQPDRERYQQYVEKYGLDNARYLREQQDKWMSIHNRAAFVNTGLGNVERYRGLTQQLARTRGWTYAEIPGDLSLIDALFAGQWDPELFLVVQPGLRIAMDYNSHVIVAV